MAWNASMANQTLLTRHDSRPFHWLRSQCSYYMNATKEAITTTATATDRRRKHSAERNMANVRSCNTFLSRRGIAWQCPTSTLVLERNPTRRCLYSARDRHECIEWKEMLPRTSQHEMDGKRRVMKLGLRMSNMWEVYSICFNCAKQFSSRLHLMTMK